MATNIKSTVYDMQTSAAGGAHPHQTQRRVKFAVVRLAGAFAADTYKVSAVRLPARARVLPQLSHIAGTGALTNVSLGTSANASRFIATVATMTLAASATGLTAAGGAPLPLTEAECDIMLAFTLAADAPSLDVTLVLAYIDDIP